MSSLTLRAGLQNVKCMCQGGLGRESRKQVQDMSALLWSLSSHKTAFFSMEEGFINAEPTFYQQ